MAKIPEPQNKLSNLIDSMHEEIREKPRGHFGASTLGDECDRKLWLSFRWAVADKIKGRTLRIFRRGQNEEEIIVQDLRRVGVDVRNTGEKQSRVNFGSHVSGSIDGVIVSGLPGKEKSKAVLEIKTHNDKSFKDVIKNGVEKSKPLHYAQMQVYMLGTGIDRALYLAVNKNDDCIYDEWIKLDKEKAEKLINRAQRIALSDRIPEPISTDPTWYKCKLCPNWAFCHETHITDQIHCRTCALVTPCKDSTWRCEKYGETIPEDFQHKGCEAHVLHPDLVPYKRLPSNNEFEAVYEIDGQQVRNGEPCANTFSSKEILANPKACAHNDEVITYARTEMNARIVGPGPEQI